MSVLLDLSRARYARANTPKEPEHLWRRARRTRSSSRRAVSTGQGRQLGEQLHSVAGIGAEIALT